MSDINVFISFHALKSNWTWCLERNAPSSEPMSHLQDDRLTVLITFRCDEKVIEKRMEESELNFTFSIKDLEAVIPSSNLWMFLTSDVLKIPLNTLRVRAASCSTSTIRASASNVHSHPSWPHDFQVFWFLIFWNKFLKNFAFKTQLFSIRLPVASNFLLMAATCEIVTISYFHFSPLCWCFGHLLRADRFLEFGADSKLDLKLETWTPSHSFFALVCI